MQVFTVSFFEFSFSPSFSRALPQNTSDAEPGHTGCYLRKSPCASDYSNVSVYMSWAGEGEVSWKCEVRYHHSSFRMDASRSCTQYTAPRHIWED